jgi:radical SAM-linked protein
MYQGAIPVFADVDPITCNVTARTIKDRLSDRTKAIIVTHLFGSPCDMTAMREERLVFLEKMGAEAPPSRTEEPNVRERAHERLARGLSPHDFSQGEPVRYRLRYGKTGPMSLRGHLDFIRVIARVLRRARLPLYYTEGFSPRPLLSFGPALGLGIQSVAEYADVSLTIEIEGSELCERFAAASEPGLSLFGARRLSKGEPALAGRIDAVEYLVALPEGGVDHAARLRSFLSAPALAVEVQRKGKLRTVDAKEVVLEAELAPSGGHGELLSLLSSDPALHMRVRETSGVVSLRPAELVKAIFRTTSAFVRTACGTRGARVLLDPLEALSIDEVAPPQGTGMLPDSTVLSPTM